MIDDNNVDAETKVISDLTNCQTNQNNNDNRDSDNEIFFTWKNKNNRCKHDKDNNMQNKDKYKEQSTNLPKEIV